MHNNELSTKERLIMYDKNEILSELKKYKSILKKKYGIKTIGVFGSIAKGTTKKNSDLDIVVEVEKLKPFLLLEIKQELERYFNMKVDLIRIRKNIRKSLKNRIDKEVIYV